MITVDLLQGSPAWVAHRAGYWNASDAPAMMSCSPHKNRRKLLREFKTGVIEEFDEATRKRFANGHRLESLARPIAETIIGETLYPVTGVEGKWSASFDGLTLDERTGFEHKALNDELRRVFAANDELPLYHRVQLQHQFYVSKAERILFMASEFDANDDLVEEHHRWVYPDLALQAQIEAGWKQFESDVSAFEIEESREPAPVGSSPETLPALLIEVTGNVLSSNLDTFKTTALTAIRNVNRTLSTDQDFADAEQSVKWCKEVESRIEAAKQHALAQTATIDELFRTLDDIAGESKRVRLDLEKRVKVRKEEIKAAIVMKSRTALEQHVAAINAEIAPFRVPFAMPDLAGEIKGKRSIDAMEDALDAAVAAGKIAADSAARVVRANVVLYRREAEGMEFLFADVWQHIAKPEEDFAELVTSRIERHRAAEEARKAADKLREANNRVADARREAEAASEPEAKTKRHAESSHEEPFADPDEPATLNLSAINARLGFTLSVPFVAETLGIEPAAKQKRSVLFTETQFLVLCGRLRDHIRTLEGRGAGANT